MNKAKKKRTGKITKQKTRLHKSKSKNNSHYLTKNRLMVPAALLVIILVMLVFLRPVFIGYFAL